MTSELYQLHEMETFSQIYDIKLTKKYRTYAIVYLILLTEKRDDRTKGRNCADEIKQELYI